MAEIPATLAQPLGKRTLAAEIALGVGADLAAPEQHAVVRIGALDRIAQLNDQPGVQQGRLEPLGRLG